MLHDPMFDMYELDISDGVHSFTVNLDTELNYLVEENKIEIFDIFMVRKAWGHPQRFRVDFVSILLIKIFFIIFLNLQIDIEVPKANPQNCIGAPGRVFIALQCFFQDLIVNLDSAHVTIVFED